MRPLRSRRQTICAQCLRTIRRTYSSASTSLPSYPPSSGFARLTNRRLISLHGADAPKFLQGLTTNNLHPSWTSGWYSAFLTAQGRVLWDVFVYPTAWSRMYKDWLDGTGTKGRNEGDWSCLIEVDAGEVDSMLRHLKRHKLRSKVEVRAVQEGEWDVFAAWGDEATSSSEGGRAQSVPDSAAPIHLVDPRVLGFGQRTILPSQSSAAGTAALERLTETDLSAYTLRRYLHGIPEGQNEILRDHALPQESDIDYMNGVDFRKGCYVGQELTIRTHHTGVVRKRIIPVQLYSTGTPAPEKLEYDQRWKAESPPRGADIKKAEGKGRSAGKFLAGIGNVGFGLCRLEMMTDVRLTAEGGMYRDGDEFRLQWEGSSGDVRIKAFVPEWIRSKLQIRDAPRRVE